MIVLPYLMKDEPGGRRVVVGRRGLFFLVDMWMPDRIQYLLNSMGWCERFSQKGTGCRARTEHAGEVMIEKYLADRALDSQVRWSEEVLELLYGTCLKRGVVRNICHAPAVAESVVDPSGEVDQNKRSRFLLGWICASFRYILYPLNPW